MHREEFYGPAARCTADDYCSILKSSVKAAAGTMRRPLLLPALLLLVLSAFAAVGGALAATSQVVFRNGSLGVDSRTCDPRVVAAMVSNMEPKGLNATTEQILRTKYPLDRQAYLCPSGEVCTAGQAQGEQQQQSVAQPRAGPDDTAVPTGDTFIVVGEPNRTYEAVNVTLGQRNTLSLATGDVITFRRSNLTLGFDNWLFLSNGTTLSFEDSNHFATSFIAWYTEYSTLLATDSTLQFTDIAVIANNSRWRLTDSVWTVPYINVSRPILWFDRSELILEGTRATWSDADALLSHSILRLHNSTLELVDTYLELWASALELVNSSIVLVNGGEINLKCHSTAGAEGVVASDGGFLMPDLPRYAKAPQRGVPLGASDADIANQPSGIIELVPIG